MWPTVLLTWTSIIVQVASLPTLSFPVNSQLPPIARVGQLFSFQFANSTFSSPKGIRGYTLANGPAWLHLDSASRTLSGTPSTGDVGSFIVSLSASDPDGSVVDQTTLIVAADHGLQVLVPIGTQLRKLGNLRDGTHLLYYADHDFSLTLDPNTFGQTSSTHYYAVSNDNTPLPAWLKFIPSTLTICGRTPKAESLAALPQGFDINIIASNTPGFTGAIVSFSIEVGAHELRFAPYEVLVSAAYDQPLTTDAFRNTLFLDQAVISDANIANVNIDGPSWLQIDKASFKLSGTVPAGASSTNVTITTTDVFKDSASLKVRIIVSDSLLVGPLPGAEATPGQDFSYTISASALKDPNTVLGIRIPSNASWLSFDAGKRTITGRVPSDAAPGPLDLPVDATLGSATAVAILVITVRDPSNHSSSTSASVSGALSTGASNTGAPTSVSQIPDFIGATSQQLSATCIAVITVLSTILAAILALALCCCLRRRRRGRRGRRGKRGKNGSKGDLAEVEEGSEQAIVPPGVVLQPPAVADADDRSSSADPPPFFKRLSGLRSSKIPSARMRFSGHSFFEETTTPPIAVVNHATDVESNFIPRPAPPPPIELPQASTEAFMGSLRPAARDNDPANYLATAGTEPRLDRRVSGVGHGAGVNGPTGFGVARRSWRGTGISNASWETGTGSSVLTADTVSTELLNNDPTSLRWIATPEPAQLKTHASNLSARSRRMSRHGVGSYRVQSPFFSASSDRFGKSSSWQRRSHLHGASPSKSSAVAAEEGTSVLSRIIETYSHSRSTLNELDEHESPSRTTSHRSRLRKRSLKRLSLSRMSSKASAYSGLTGQFDSAHDLGPTSRPPLPTKNSYVRELEHSRLQPLRERQSEVLGKRPRPRSAMLGRDSNGDLFSDFDTGDHNHISDLARPLRTDASLVFAPSLPLRSMDPNAGRSRRSMAEGEGGMGKAGDGGFARAERGASEGVAFI